MHHSLDSEEVSFIFSISTSARFFFFFNSSDSSSDQGPSSNKFVNDGSFLQQFMKMQKEKSNSVSGEYPKDYSFRCGATLVCGIPRTVDIFIVGQSKRQ